MSWPPPPPPVYQSATPPAPVGEYAGWGARLGATLIDVLVLFAIVAVFIVLAVIAQSEAIAGVAVILIYGGSFLYGPLTMMRGGERNGQTYGKQAMGIRVVRDTGQPLGFGWSLLREALAKGLIGPLTLYIDFLWPLWDDHNQALHDKMVGTFVVKA